MFIKWKQSGSRDTTCRSSPFTYMAHLQRSYGLRDTDHTRSYDMDANTICDIIWDISKMNQNYIRVHVWVQNKVQ